MLISFGSQGNSAIYWQLAAKETACLVGVGSQENAFHLKSNI
jgi:hypothetical protein